MNLWKVVKQQTGLETTRASHSPAELARPVTEDRRFVQPLAVEQQTASRQCIFYQNHRFTFTSCFSKCSLDNHLGKLGDFVQATKLFNDSRRHTKNATLLLI